MNTSTDKRVRFNWGYHDAAHSVRNGWDNAGNYWGFAKNMGQKMVVPKDIIQHHFDKAYAKGWLAGFEAARDGQDTKTSEPAWIESKKVA